MPTVYLRCKWWILLLSSLNLSSAWAEENIPVPIKIQLVSDVSTLAPGQPFTIGLLLEHAAHHHSYYKFSGIVGVPTSIAWTLPDGFAAGPLQWPTPEQVDMRGHGAYGYHEDTLLLTEITPPKTLSDIETVTLSGRVGYMCCSQERCTPGFEDVKITLTVGAKATVDTTWQPRITLTQDQLPKPSHHWKAEVQEMEEHFVLSLQPTTPIPAKDLPKPEALYFFSWNGWTASDKPHECQWKSTHFEFSMPKHPFPEEGASRFQGVIRSDTGWPGEPSPQQGLWIDLPLPPAKK